MSSSKIRLVGLVAAGFVMFVAGAVNAEEAPPHVHRAVRAVQREAKSITAWAYPTVTFRGFDGCYWMAATGELACRFSYADIFGERESRVLKLSLDGDGLVSGIADGGGESVIAPFTTAKGLKGLLAAMAKADLERNSGGDDEGRRQLIELLSSGPEPEQVLTFLLNVAIFFQS